MKLDVNDRLVKSYEMYTGGNYAGALPELLELVNEDKSGYAALYLGAMYYLGKGVAADRQLAENYFKDASEKGIQSAKSNLAMIYESKGAADKAAELYLSIANTGEAQAMYKLFVLKNKFPSLSIDTETVEKFLSAAAEKKYGMALLEIQKRELSGRYGVVRKVKAVALYPIRTLAILKAISSRVSDKNIEIVN